MRARFDVIGTEPVITDANEDNFWVVLRETPSATSGVVKLM